MAVSRQHDVATASMRPPQFAGEDLLRSLQHGADRAASMRPPQFAGEDDDEAARRLVFRMLQ